MVPRICAVKKRQAETGEDINHLFYIRGILRNRFSYCNDRTALELLKAADAMGLDEQDLKDIAVESRNWTEWQNTMHQAMEIQQ